MATLHWQVYENKEFVVTRSCSFSLKGLNSITLVGHSQGSLIVGNSLLNLGFSDNRNVVVNSLNFSSPLSQPRVLMAAAIGGGLDTKHVFYGNNFGDPINIVGPNIDPAKFLSGFTFQIQNH